MPGKRKFAFFQLSSCWGCNQSLLNAHLGLISILPELEIVYWPALVDFKLQSLIDRPDESIDVGFIEGVARTKEDTKNALLMRKKCKYIICVGACACYGGVIGLANLFDKEELIKRKFIEVESITNESPEEPKDHVPGFEDYIVNIKDIIEVDMFIPGCPPQTENIISAISYLLQYLKINIKSPRKNKSVCSICKLYKKGCFLNKNKLCFGPITAIGCTLICPNNGDQCYGCFGPVSYPDNKIEHLKNMLIEKETLTKEDTMVIEHFLHLFLYGSNINCFYFRGDLLQRLAYEPNSFKKKELEIQNRSKLIYDLNLTNNDEINNIIGISLSLLKDNPNFKFSVKTVCSQCNREFTDKVPVKLKRDYMNLPNENKCLLEQGYICLGPVTLAGCGAICPNKANAPCLGCYGPPMGIKDQGAKFITTLGSLTTDKDIKELMEIIKDPAGLFNMFSLADSTLKHKYHDNFPNDDKK